MSQQARDMLWVNDVWQTNDNSLNDGGGCWVNDGGRCMVNC